MQILPILLRITPEIESEFEHESGLRPLNFGESG